MDQNLSNSGSQYATAMNMLGNHYDNMKTCDNFAMELYKKSYKKGYHIAYYNYADMLSKVNIKDIEAQKKRNAKCLKIIEKYIKLVPNDPDGYHCMGNIYNKMKEYDKTQECFEKAIKLGKIQLINMISWDKKDAEKIQELVDSAYSKFIENPKLLNYKSINLLGLIYSDGLYNIKRNYNNAFEIWEIGVNKGIVGNSLDDTIDKTYEEMYPTLLFNLGFCYKYGEGVKRDLKKAKELFEKSIEIGNDTCSSSYRELGLLYEYEMNNDVKLNYDTSIKYFTLGANVKNPDPTCCLKVVKYLQKTKGTVNNYKYGPKVYYDKNITKTQSQYILKYIKSYEYSSDQPKDALIPFNVLIQWKDKMAKMTKLKEEIAELQLRPPNEGGKLYLEAKNRFNENIKKINNE